MLGSQLLTLPQIFDENLFSVPDYQRGFAWGEKEVGALLEDIDHLLLSDEAGFHFTGTLVVNFDSKAGRYDIVDGQQRLTSIVLLMRCLWREMEKSDPEMARGVYERYIRRGGIGNETLTLQLGSDSRDFFERLILSNHNIGQMQATLAAHHNLFDAKDQIEKWLQSKPNTLTIRLLHIMESRLGLLVYNPSGNAEVGVMFEVINNRGKQLSQLEKVKNYLIYVATKLGASATRNMVNTRWSAILKNLNAAGFTSDSQEDSFLRAAAVLHYSLNKKDSGKSYDVLRSKFLKIATIVSDEASRTEAIRQIESFVELLDEVAFWHSVIYGGNREKLDKDFSEVIERIYAQQQHANIMPLLMAVLIKDSHNRLRLLEIIEKVNFRVYVARAVTDRTDSGQGRLFSLAADYYHERIDGIGKNHSQIDLDKRLEVELVRFGVTRAPDDALKQSLFLDSSDNYFDFYSWRGLKYFLISYEASLKESKTIRIGDILNERSSGKTGDYYSVEHIWAQKHEAQIYSGSQDGHIRRRLGNFVLLELDLNIRGSHKSIIEKIDIYGGRAPEGEEKPKQPTDLAQARELITDVKAVMKSIPPKDFTDGRRRPYRAIHAKLCDKREERFEAFAVKHWSLKGYDGYSEAISSVADDIQDEDFE